MLYKLDSKPIGLTFWVAWSLFLPFHCYPFISNIFPLFPTCWACHKYYLFSSLTTKWRLTSIKTPTEIEKLKNFGCRYQYECPELESKNSNCGGYSTRFGNILITWLFHSNIYFFVYMTKLQMAYWWSCRVGVSA